MKDKNEKQMQAYLNDLIPKHDLVIISDYGHGFISRESAKNISKRSIFTSLNAQINAANIGYHTMNNYRDIECTIINENELRHELRNRERSVETLMKQLSESLNVIKLVVTCGRGGAMLFDSEKNMVHHCPAFASKVVDKIGAGDAMLALISCSLKNGFSADLSLFIGSLAAAQSVETIGNSTPVSKIKLLKTIQHATK
jgi:bifunctional ADP-heptose synthase (sugar kinase/adenylyltransferase)